MPVSTVKKVQFTVDNLYIMIYNIISLRDKGLITERQRARETLRGKE